MNIEGLDKKYYRQDFVFIVRRTYISIENRVTTNTLILCRRKTTMYIPEGKMAMCMNFSIEINPRWGK